MEYTLKEPLSVLEALTLLSPDSSKTTLREWLKEGRITVDGAPVKLANTQLQANQIIALTGKKRVMASKVPILYEDAHLVVVDKPIGWLSVATHFEKEETIHGFLKERYRPKKVYVVHRLDQDTSGVMLFALSEEAYEGLKALFKEHTIEREYVAVSEGKLAAEKGTWQSYLHEDAAYHVHSSQNPEKGQLAITHYEVLNSARNTLLKLRLETGKKNQIRVHCQENGCPIIGDKKYGGRESLIKRLCLHAHLLGFIHPITKKEMSFRSPIPEKFYHLLK